MKRVISILLLLSLAASFSACTPHRTDEVSCEDIIAAYEKAGYTLGHHLHEDPVYLEDGICCSLLFEDPQTPDKNYIYIDRHNSTQDAKSAANDQKHNLVLWFMSALYGETRWLRHGCLGEIHYSTYEREMIKPLREMAK